MSAEEIITELGGRLSPDADAPVCVLCNGSCTCASARDTVAQWRRGGR
jgi:hypothetical protein